MYQPGLQTYRKMAVTTLDDPRKIVYLLFEKAIQELRLAEVNLDRPLERDRHLGKAIAVVGELQAGVDLEAGEAAEFIFGLYRAIIRELAKVKGPEDREVVARSIRYLSELKNIWARQVLGRES